MSQIQEAPLRRILLLLLILIAALYLVSLIWSILATFGSVILLFFSAWLISFILSPLANWLERRRHVPRLLAVAALYLTLTLVLVASIRLATPLIGEQVNQISQRIRTLFMPANLQYLTATLVVQLRAFGCSDQQAHHIINQVTANVTSSVQSGISSLLANTAVLLSSISTLLLDMVIVLILSFYMMLDGRRILDTLIDRLPLTWHQETRRFEKEIARVFGGFIRSQLIIGLSYGILTWFMLVVLRVPNGFLIGLLSGLILIFPFIGPPLALLPPLLLTLLEVPMADVSQTAILLLVLLFLSQQLVMQGIAPRVMSQGVGLHPIWLFAALLAAAKIAGVWGAFFAAPIAALVAVIFDHIYAHATANDPRFSRAAAQTVAPAAPQEQIVLPHTEIETAD